MELTINAAQVEGLGDREKEQLFDLTEIFNHHQPRNREKEKYYQGEVTLGDVNLGLALPEDLKKLSVGCEWGAKAVDVLAARSMFDGFVNESGENDEIVKRIIEDNGFIAQYNKACRDQLKFGCTFATLSADEKIGCRIRYHSPMTAAANWNGEKGRIDCGFAIIDAIRHPNTRECIPSLINLYTEDAIWTLRLIGEERWSAEKYPQKMGRPLMEPMIWNGTSAKPFGRSRLKYPIRALIDGYVRTIANATIALEFDTTPQKYLLGVSDEMYDALINQKFKQYIGSILAATTNPETGEKPTFGQLQQGNLQPHVEMIRILATQFSAATGLSVVDTGIINDANPTSSDAILAQSQTLVLLAEQLNKGNGDALRNIALMAEAIATDKSLEELPTEARGIIAHFKNPAMPSVSVTADAAIKIATSRPEFASTDTFLEMIGFDQADIRRIKSEEQRARGQMLLSEVE